MPEGNLMDEIMPEPFYLPEDEKERSRGLYKEAFPEDTEKFVDFFPWLRLAIFPEIR